MHIQPDTLSPGRILRDDEKRLSKAFNVTGYPGIFLFDRQGLLGVAQPHRMGLWDAVGRLVVEMK